MSEKLIIKNTIFLMCSSVLNMFVSIFTTSLIAKTFGPELYGKYTFGLTYILLFSAFSNFGLESLFVRESAKDYKNINKMVYNIIIMKIIIVLATIFILIEVSHLFSYDRSTIVVIELMSIGLFFQVLSDVILAVYRSTEKMHVVAFCSSFFRISTAILIFLSIYLKIGFLAIVYSYVIGRTLVFLLLAVIYFQNFDTTKININFNEWYNLIKRGAPFYLSAVFTMIYMKITVIFLSKMRGEFEIGIFMAASTLVDSLLFLPDSFNMSIFPAFSRIYGQSISALNKTYFKSMKYVLMVTGAISVGTILLSKKIILFIYGPKFLPAFIALDILILFWMLTFFSNLMSNLLFSINKENIQMKIVGFSCIVNIIMNIIFVPLYGYIGSAISFLVSGGITFFLILIMLWRHGFRYYPDLNTIKIIPILILMVIAVKLSINYSIYINVLVGAIVFGVSLFIFKVFDEDDLSYFRLLSKKI